MSGQDAPRTVDRSRFFELMKGALTIDPRRTAVVTIDCHRGHLDPEVATMPVAPEAAARVVAATARLVRFARSREIPVIHVILHNRILPDGTSEPLRNPFWKAVEDVNQMLTPERESTISRHNLAGSVQTELMPELGPEPGDFVIRTKRRLSVFRDTDLDLTLHELGADTLVLAGINTNTCVTCASFESLNRDLATIVVSDCVHSMYGDDLHFFGLQNIARCLGWVLTLDEVMEKVDSSRPAPATAR
ncbi:MAG: cysteine hydrolase [Candidatus Dormibacterales bacterium]